MGRTRRLAASRTLLLAIVLCPVTVMAQGASGQRSSWFASLGAGQGWDNNVRYEADSSRISDQNRRLNATAQITRVRARTTLGLSASGSVVRYQTLKALDVVSPAWAAHVDERIDVDVRVAGVAEDHAPHASRGESGSHPTHIIGESRRRHRSVLDELH